VCDVPHVIVVMWSLTRGHYIGALSLTLCNNIIFPHTSSINLWWTAKVALDGYLEEEFCCPGWGQRREGLDQLSLCHTIGHLQLTQLGSHITIMRDMTLSVATPTKVYNFIFDLLLQI
jgi:hypothetical protein